MPTSIDSIREFIQSVEAGALVNLGDIFNVGELSPPPSIQMDSFRPDLLVQGIVHNLAKTNASLDVQTWQHIIQFCNGASAFSSNVDQLKLQVLFILSKADSEGSEAKYEMSMKKFVDLLLININVSKYDGREMVRIKEFLLRPLIIKAMQKSLAAVFDEEIEAAWIQATVSSMIIYYANMNHRLRGACLWNGFFVNLRQIHDGGRWGKVRRFLLPRIYSSRHEADLLTVAVHETTHFLARMHSNNFNFSTPFSGILQGNVRMETNVKKLELGRWTELILFGIQPCWKTSSNNAADLFLQRAANADSTLPLFQDDGERRSCGMESRAGGSTSSGLYMDVSNSQD